MTRLIDVICRGWVGSLKLDIDLLICLRWLFKRLFIWLCICMSTLILHLFVDFLKLSETCVYTGRERERDVFTPPSKQESVADRWIPHHRWLL